MTFNYGFAQNTENTKIHIFFQGKLAGFSCIEYIQKQHSFFEASKQPEDYRKIAVKIFIITLIKLLILAK